MMPVSISIAGLGDLKSFQAQMLHPEDLDWIGVRFLDPTGRVFRREGRYFRAVYPASAEHVQSLFRSGVLAELQERDLCCKFRICDDIAVRGYAFVVEQEAADFTCAPHYWNRYLLRDAALAYIEINRLLLKHNLALLDGHADNFAQFGKASPKWFDLGSICPCRSPLMGLEEFARYLLIPLIIASRSAKLGGLMRVLVKNASLGMQEVKDLLGVDITFGGKRETILNDLYNLIQSMQFPAESTLWSNYHNPETMNTELIDSESNPRGVLIRHFITEFAPQSVTDIGCNAGYFTMLAAQSGAAVHAFDTDEPSNEAFYRYLKHSPKMPRVTLSVQSAVTLNEAPENQTDLVLALALTHHLFLSQQFKFDYIAKALASFSKSTLITEFMPNGLSTGVNATSKGLPAEYTLEHLMFALSRHFQQVQAFADYLPQGASPRTLVVCSGKRNE